MHKSLIVTEHFYKQSQQNLRVGKTHLLISEFAIKDVQRKLHLSLISSFTSLPLVHCPLGGATLLDPSIGVTQARFRCAPANVENQS